MGKRKAKKGRSVRMNKNYTEEPEELVKAPHSFVIHRGQNGGHCQELSKDFRRVLEPYTASQLKERRKNSIKDFVQIAGPLNVTHMEIFSQTSQGMYMKLLKLPRGPSLIFKIESFTLTKDLISSLKHQIVIEDAFKRAPLVILNNFSSSSSSSGQDGEGGAEIKLMAKMFQNLFPALNLNKCDLNQVRRCVMLNYNTDTKLIDFRHYNIKICPTGVSKNVKKLSIKSNFLPNLSQYDDITGFFNNNELKSDFSDIEADAPLKNEILAPKNPQSRGTLPLGKAQIRLSELGPRLTLKLLKIEDGLLDGAVLYHDLVEKTVEERLEIEKRRELKRKLRERRRKEQEQNRKLKVIEKEEQKKRSLKGMAKAQEQQPEPDDDNEYFRQELGTEPEVGFFPEKKRRKIGENNVKEKDKKNKK